MPSRLFGLSKAMILKMSEQTQQQNASGTHADNNGQWQSIPELMTEEELVRFLRIPEVSKSKNHRQVIAHLKRFHKLPCIHISRQPLYPLEAIRQWVMEKVQKI